MEPQKDDARPDPDEPDHIVKGEREDLARPGDLSASGEPVDAAEQDPTPDEA